MDIEIQSALILAGGTVLAASIGAISIGLVAIHRKWVISLARSVEHYYNLETKWVKRVLESEGKAVTDTAIRSRRDLLRTELLWQERPEFMNGKAARGIRAKYLSFDG